MIQNKFKTITMLSILCFCCSLYSQDIAENQLIIKFKSPEAHRIDASTIGCKHIDDLRFINAEVWEIPDTVFIDSQELVGLEAVVDHLKSYRAIVEYVEKNSRVELHGQPNDALYSQMWSPQVIDAEPAWDLQQGDRNIIVAVIDSGADLNHPDLAPNLWQNLGEDADGDGTVIVQTGTGWGFDPDDMDGIDNDNNGYVDDFRGWNFVDDNNDLTDECYHGTHVAGTIGAVGNNSIGVIGISPNVTIMPIKAFFLDNGFCIGVQIDGLVKSLEYAVEMGAQISNCSWGQGFYSEALLDAIDLAGAQNHMLVASAGNYGQDADLVPTNPAAFDLPNIISVGSSDPLENPSIFAWGGISNYGNSSVDLFAPGSNILSTIPGAAYEAYGGTSMAAPHVAGAVALIASHCGQFEFQAIKEAILNGVETFPQLTNKCVTGGRLNLYNSLTTDLLCETAPLPPAPACAALAADSLALLAIHQATNGENWNHRWDLTAPVSSWYGVGLSSDGCHVICLDLDGYYNCTKSAAPDGNNLTGFLPPEIGNLSQLQTLSLRNNQQLTGALPPELGNLTNLQDLALININASGQIPEELFQLQNLKNLYLGENPLTGSIPAEIENCISLQKLFLQDCLLSGTIPEAIGYLPDLQWLYLQNNLLTGCYPESLCNIPYSGIPLSSNFNCTGNEGLPNGGSDQGLNDFCYYGVSCQQEDCPQLGNLGDACDDQDSNTMNDSVQPGCYCQGEIIQLDCDGGNIGDTCNDGNNNTANDVIQSDCSCAGTTIADCPPITFDLGPDQGILCGESIPLSVGDEDFTNIVWSYEGLYLSADTSDLIAHVPGNYSVVVTDGCGTVVEDHISLIELEDCVWPGDFNGDGIVDVLDLLAWGAAAPKTGPERNNANNGWIGQSAPSWGAQSPNGVDVKHVDANGSGVIDVEDLDVFALNFGQTHDSAVQLLAGPVDGIMGPLTDWSRSSVSDGQLSIDIVMMQTQESITGISGEFDLGELEVSAVNFEYQDSWFGLQEEVESYLHLDPYNNKIHLGLTRKDGVAVIGEGIVGQLNLKEPPNDPWLDSPQDFVLEIQNPRIMNQEGSLGIINAGVSLHSVQQTEAIALQAGWNQVVFTVIPSDTEMSSVFSSLKPENLQYVISYESGPQIYSPDLPDEDCTLKEIKKGQGYWVKVSHDDVLYLNGDKIPESFRTTLADGWTLLGFHSSFSYSPEVYFEQLLEDDLSFRVVDFLDPNAHFDSSDALLNATLEELKPKHNYWVKLEPEEPIPTSSQNLPSNRFDYLLGHTDLAPGSEIEMYCNGELIGTLLVDQEHQFAPIPLVADDQHTTEVVEGLQPGDLVYFEFNGQLSSSVLLYQGAFLVHEIELLFSNTSVDSTISRNTIEILTNPVRDALSFRIELEHPKPDLNIKCFDQLGKLVFDSKISKDEQLGKVLNFDLQNFRQGPYYYRISGEQIEKTGSFFYTGK